MKSLGTHKILQSHMSNDLRTPHTTSQQTHWRPSVLTQSSFHGCKKGGLDMSSPHVSFFTGVGPPFWHTGQFSPVVAMGLLQTGVGFLEEWGTKHSALWSNSPQGILQMWNGYLGRTSIHLWHTCTVRYLEEVLPGREKTQQGANTASKKQRLREDIPREGGMALLVWKLIKVS